MIRVIHRFKYLGFTLTSFSLKNMAKQYDKNVNDDPRIGHFKTEVSVELLSMTIVEIHRFLFYVDLNPS